MLFSYFDLVHGFTENDSFAHFPADASSLLRADELPVVLLVASQDVLQRTHESLERISLEADGADLRASGDDAGGSGQAFQQGSLAEVVARLVHADRLGLLTGSEHFERLTSALYYHVEAVAMLTLVDDRVAVLEPLLSERVGHAAAFDAVHALEDVHLTEERVVALTLPLHRRLDEAGERRTVELPQLAVIRLAHNSGGTRRVVQQSELSEGLARLVLSQLGRLRVTLEDLRADQRALLDQVEVIAIVSLLDDCVTSFGRLRLHRVEH